MTVPTASSDADIAISLVVCTRNRAPQLSACLEAVAALRYDGLWEFVVVDNGSNDATAQVIKAFAARAPFPVHYVHQPVKGLSNARNAGIAQARGRIVAFTDDDCYVAPDLLVAVEAVFANPQIGYASGRVLLHDPTDYPATISLSQEPIEVASGRYIVPGVFKGANMAFRHEAVQRMGGFDPWFGSGASFPSEDCDAAARASLQGWVGRYEPAMVVSHHHGRKADTIGPLFRDYDVGRGAYHAKLLLSCRAPKQALRGWGGLLRRALWRPVSLYWESYGAMHYAWMWLTRRP